MNINNVIKVEDGIYDTNNYTLVYKNESFSYCIKTNLWQNFTDLLDLVEIRSLNLKVHTYLSRVVPEYGKPLFVLLSMVSNKITNVHVTEDVLNALVVDNLLVVGAIEELKQTLKESKVYVAMEKRLDTIAKNTEHYRTKIDSITAVNNELTDQNKALISENKELKKRIQQLEKVAIIKKTGKWEDETRLPLLRNHNALNQMLLRRTSPVNHVNIGKNIYINVPEDMSEESMDFLVKNYHYILEFIAIKFQQLIPYIKRYYKLKEESK